LIFASPPALLFVNFATVADAEDQDYEAVVFQGADEAVVADAVFPEFAESALESFTDFVGIV
jgi:hypothetical protein